jgi:cell division protein FtsW
MNPLRKGSPDFLLMFLTLILTGFGILMVFSASSATAAIEYNDSLHFTKRQIMWAGAGLFFMLILMNIPFQWWKKLIFPIFIMAIASLVLVLIIGVERNGARSWFQIGPFGGQPTEFAKLAVVMYLATLISRKGEKFRDFKRGLLPVMIIVGIVCALIMMQPDLGSCFILVLTAGLVIIAGGANLKHILLSGLFLSGILGFVIGGYFLFTPADQIKSYRIDRFTSYLDPWADPLDTGFQLIQSLYAFGHGGVTGAGFGQSIQKLHYLPYAYNDFIFAVIGEELGLIGALTVLLALLLLMWRALIISLRCPDIFGTLLGTGIVGMIGIQAIINLGGVTGLIPITGVTLPFISYGGSSLLVTLMCMGLLLNISRYSSA